MKLAAKAFIVRDRRLLLIKRHSYDSYPGIWEVPGGKLEAGETLEEGLRREVLEEVGLPISIISPLKVHHFKHQEGYVVHLTSFLCNTEGEASLGKEVAEIKWVPLENAEKTIHTAFGEEPSIIRNHTFSTKKG